MHAGPQQSAPAVICDLLSYLRQQGALSPGSACISTLLLRVMQVLRRLKHASEAGKLPCDDADLTFIVRMLQVGFALACPACIHGGRTQPTWHLTQQPRNSLALHTTANTLEST